MTDIKFKEAVELAERFASELNRHPDFTEVEILVIPGRSWVKLVAESTKLNTVNSRRVFAFMDIEGNLWKAASWKAPQKNALRYNANEVMTMAVQDADPYDSFLYVNR